MSEEIVSLLLEHSVEEWSNVLSFLSTESKLNSAKVALFIACFAPGRDLTTALKTYWSGSVACFGNLTRTDTESLRDNEFVFRFSSSVGGHIVLSYRLTSLTHELIGINGKGLISCMSCEYSRLGDLALCLMNSGMSPMITKTFPFVGLLTREKTKELLAGRSIGTYLVRFSNSEPNSFVVAHVCHGGVRQILCRSVFESPEVTVKLVGSGEETPVKFPNVDHILSCFPEVFTEPWTGSGV